MKDVTTIETVTRNISFSRERASTSAGGDSYGAPGAWLPVDAQNSAAPPIPTDLEEACNIFKGLLVGCALGAIMWLAMIELWLHTDGIFK